MKHIKHFKNTNKPQAGDYVICIENGGIQAVKNFVDNNIGIIVKVKNRPNFPYRVKYENIPIEIEEWFTDESREMSEKEIIHFSKNKEDLEIYIQANKYNL